MLILGAITLTTPQYSLRALGIIIAITGIIFSAKQIIDTATSKFKPQQKRFFIISWLVIFGLSVALISNNQILIFLAHYFLGIFLVIYSYIRLRQVILKRIPGIPRKIFAVLEAIVSFVLGIIIVVNTRDFSKQSMQIFGILLVAYGFFMLIGELFSQRKKLPSEHR